MRRNHSEENLLHTATTSPNDYQAKLRIPIAVLGIQISNNHLAAIEYLPLVIPCHHVIAKDNLGGFNGGRRGPSIDIKHWLLRHENASY